MTSYGQPWPAMASHGRPWAAMAGHGVRSCFQIWAEFFLVTFSGLKHQDTESGESQLRANGHGRPLSLWPPKSLQ